MPETTWKCKNKPIVLVTHGGYTLTQILDNKHCSKDPKYWVPIYGTDKYLFRSDVAESWEFFDPMIKNPIANTNQIYIRFLNVSVFTEAADSFKMNGYYCPAPEDTILFNQFWDEQEDSCDYGIEVDGIRITGRFYFWLNFGRLKATENKRKIEREPSFIDHQYYWSLELEESGLEGPYSDETTYLDYFPNKETIDFKRLRKEGMVVAKGRRKGYSYYKASALHTYNFTWLADSMNILAAFEKGHYKVPLDAIHMNLNFLNKNTPWVRRRGVKNVRDNFRASVKILDEFGVEIEEGYKSEVNCISFADDPFKGIGDCFSPETEVIMYDTSLRKIKDIVIGDLVLGIDGTPRVVLSTHSGVDTMTTFSQNKGVNFTVNSRHRHYGYNAYDKEVFTISNEEFLKKGKAFKRYFRTIRPDKMTISENKLGIDPYFYGLWLGDGDKDRAAIASEDIETELYLTQLAEDLGLSIRKKEINENKANHYTLGGRKGNWKTKTNSILEWLKSNNLIKNKHILPSVITTSEEDRLLFIAGLIDSDGHLSTDKKRFFISQKDVALLEDAAMIARSLGFYANVNTYSRTSGLGKELKDISRLTISGDIWNIPVNVTRKRPEVFIHKSPIRESSIKEINTYVGDYCGFELDGDHLFLLKDFTIVHNSCDYIDIEEAGKFVRLLETYEVSVGPLIRDGDVMIGIPLIGGCVCKGTKVYTDKGIPKNIEEVVKGDRLMSTTSEEVTWLKPISKKQCYRIATSKENFLECSYDHPILVSNTNKGLIKEATFKRACDLQPGDRIFKFPNLSPFGTKSIKNARIIGLLIGDGNYGDSGGTQLYIAEDNIYEWLCSTDQQLTTHKQWELSNGNTFRRLGLPGIRPQLRELGIFGQTKGNKHLPNNVLEYDRESLSELVGGYFDADGYVNYNKKKEALSIKLTSNFKHLLDEVREVLYKFDIDATITHCIRRGGYEGGSEVCYNLEIAGYYDVLQFYKNISFKDKTKQDKLELITSLNKRSRNYHDNIDFVINPDNNKGDYFIGKSFKGVRTVRVKEIFDIGIQDVYNLTANTTHTYLTNNFLSANTAGDMEKGSIDLSIIHSDPTSYGLKGYANIYDERPDEIVGWFIDDMWMLFGFVEKEKVRQDYKDDPYVLDLLDRYDGELIEAVDDQGNSHRRIAEIIIDSKRKVKKKGASRAYNKFISQQPKTLDECFLVVEGSPFDVATIKEVLAELKVSETSGDEPGSFILDGGGKPKWRLDFTKEPIKTFPMSAKDGSTDGCWVIYEHPRTKECFNQPWRYIAGLDPIDFGADEVADSNTHSLASCFVMDTLTRTIVAEYTGRPSKAEDYYEQLWRGIEYYGGELLYENNLKGVYTYFNNKNKLHLLAKEPENLKDRSGYQKGNRLLGFHATGPINGHARDLINTWSLSEHIVGQDNTTGELQYIPKMYTIRSIPLLQELQNWRPKLNCDRVSSLGACMLLLSEREIHLENINNKVKDRFNDDEFFNSIDKFTSGHNSNNYFSDIR